MPNAAIVTGAASGIGREAARDLLAKGWVVYGLDVSDAALAPAARALASAQFHPRPCDLRDAAAVAAVEKEVEEGGIEVEGVALHERRPRLTHPPLTKLPAMLSNSILMIVFLTRLQLVVRVALVLVHQGRSSRKTHRNTLW